MALQGARVPKELHPLAREPERAVLVEFLAAAVCHRTNWDRLRKHLLRCAVDDDQFSPSRLAGLTLGQFISQFSGAFNSTSDLVDRYRMFVAVADAFSNAVNPFNRKFLTNETQRLGGSGGLYEGLNALAVFSVDPQRKKSRILVQQLVRTSLISVIDPQDLRPAIEYHLIRLYRRTGRVVRAGNQEMGGDRNRATDVRSVTALRVAVEQAMHYSAAGADLTILDLNDLEWQIARSFCDRENPRCDGPPRPDKPVVEAIQVAGGGACPFATTCDAPHYPMIAALTEPKLADHHSYY